jgi:quinolinate synthase
VSNKDKKELIEKINELKKEKRAVILAHNYQIPEVQDIADFVGDSLELSRKAAETKSKIIVFCGVHFMAESAAILSPEKTVLLPEIKAGCPMADMVTVEALKQKRAEYPEAVMVCYVNSSAAVKAESDICCTSSNAIEIVSSLKSKKIIFIPDKNLGLFVASKIENKEIILWDGFCPPHQNLTLKEVQSVKRKHPSAKVIVHPECRPEVIELADDALSTSGILKYARACDFKEMIVGTETGIIYRLQKENPKKVFIPASKNFICPNMKLTTLKSLYNALKDNKNIITVSEKTRIKAKKALDKMLEVKI